MVNVPSSGCRYSRCEQPTSSSPSIPPLQFLYSSHFPAPDHHDLLPYRPIRKSKQQTNDKSNSEKPMTKFYT